MATLFEWIRLILDKWTIIVPMLMFLGSAVGWTVTSVDNAEKDELTEAMKDQIEVLVDYKPEPVPIGRGKGVCNCKAIFSNLIKKHEAKHRSEH